MKRHFVAATVAALAGLAIVPAAHAATFATNLNGCGGTRFQTCASVNIAAAGSGVVMQVSNLPTAPGDVFVAISLEGLGPVVPSTLTVFDQHGNNVTANWSVASGAACNGMADTCLISNTGAISDGSHLTFMFTLENEIPEGLQQSDVVVAVRATRDNCESNLIFGGPNDNIGNTDFDPACETVIPEPITIVLLGSGLAGLGSAAMLRRRRRDEE